MRGKPAGRKVPRCRLLVQQARLLLFAFPQESLETIEPGKENANQPRPQSSALSSVKRISNRSCTHLAWAASLACEPSAAALVASLSASSASSSSTISPSSLLRAWSAWRRSFSCWVIACCRARLLALLFRIGLDQLSKLTSGWGAKEGKKVRLLASL